jgi:hypothetical protein
MLIEGIEKIVIEAAEKMNLRKGEELTKVKLLVSFFYPVLRHKVEQLEKVHLHP